MIDTDLAKLLRFGIQYMTTILLLFVLGIVLLFFDLFMPGIVLAVLGTVVFLGATAKALTTYGVPAGLEAFAAGALLFAIAMYVEYGILPKTRVGRKFFLNSAGHGTSQSPINERLALVGTECVVLTPLVPTGQVEIGGTRYEALSIDGHVDRGARVKVTGTQNFSLTVSKL